MTVDLQERLLDRHGRLLSLDFFRGFTMFLLISGWAGLSGALEAKTFEGTVFSTIAYQLSHAPWHGLRFWDLVQPFFMFIVGVAMPISFGKRWQRGDSWYDTFRHALKRSLILLVLGIVISLPGFQLTNVLAQLAFTYLIAFLIMRKSWAFQLVFSIGLLLLTEGLYRFWPVAGFNQPFVHGNRNVGAWLDLVLTGNASSGHWVSLNALPTAAHTIWGVLAGQVLIGSREAWDKIKILTAAGLIALLVGYALDPALLFGSGSYTITPVIKRIATSSFVIVTGGWCLLMLTFSFYLLDVVKYPISVGRFFAIVGMNPLFIYVFAHEGGASWLKTNFRKYIKGVKKLLNVPQGFPGKAYMTLLLTLLVIAAMWYIVYFLYKRKIFIKI